MSLVCIADRVIDLHTEQDIEQASQILQQTTTDNSKKPSVLVLSGGSNVLLPKQLNITVLRPLLKGITVLNETTDYIDIEVMAGENWHELVVSSVNNGWFGLENLALIPGLVGASPVQNIGAYGVQLEDSLLSVKAYHLPTGVWHTISCEDCQFAYRDSLFKRQPNTWLISRVLLRLHKDPQRVSANYGDVQQVAQKHAQQHQRISIQPVDVMNAIIDIRKQKLPDPKDLPNCGSFFQNPIIAQAQFKQLQADYPDIVGYPMSDGQVKVAAGWLIEQAGLKGGGIAPILTHKNQALVLTNHAPKQASQADIQTSQQYISQTVFDKFGVLLQREPVWIDENL